MSAEGFDSRAYLAQLTTAPGVYRMYDAGRVRELGEIGAAVELPAHEALFCPWVSSSMS